MERVNILSKKTVGQQARPDLQPAREVTPSSKYSDLQIQTALSFFLDPDNPQIQIKAYADSLLDLMAPKYQYNREELARQLGGIVDQIKDARRFNSTYLGHMLSDPSIPGLWGQSLADLVRSNTVAREVALKESALEPEAIGGLADMIGYDRAKASGTFTSGGSMANLTALTVARILLSEDYKKQHHHQIRRQVVIFASPYAHYSFDKSISLLGGVNGTEITINRIKPDDFRMSTSGLEEQIESVEAKGSPIMAIFAIAGETETGLVDDIATIAQIAERHNIRLITDGAFGAPYKISKRCDLFAGMERSFAVALDPHKALYTPYQNGAVLFKDAQDHARIKTLLAGNKVTYLHFDDIAASFRDSTVSLGQKRLEGSMGAGPILSTLAVLRTLGLPGLQIIYDLTLDRIDYLYERLSQSELLMPLYKPDINLLCFTLRPEVASALRIDMTVKDGKESLVQFIDKTRMVLDHNCEGKGGYFFSSTDLPLGEGKSVGVYRACIMNPHTTDAIVDEAVTNLESIISARLR